MTRPRTPFRLELEQLATDFAEGVLDALRRATLARLLDLDSPLTDATDARPAIGTPRQEPSVRGVRTAVGRPRKPRTPKTAARSEPPRPTTEEIEREAAPGTEIDPFAVLESLDWQPPAAHQVPPPSATPPPPTPSQSEGAERGLPSPTHASRAAEGVLRTAGGSVVLRRRRAS